MTFKISSKKLVRITEIINNDTDPRATEDQLEFHICNYDYDDDHQEWLDSASAEEIADWISETVYG